MSTMGAMNDQTVNLDLKKKTVFEQKGRIVKMSRAHRSFPSNSLQTEGNQAISLGILTTSFPEAIVSFSDLETFASLTLKMKVDFPQKNNFFDKTHHVKRRKDVARLVIL